MGKLQATQLAALIPRWQHAGQPGRAHSPPALPLHTDLPRNSACRHQAGCWQPMLPTTATDSMHNSDRRRAPLTQIVPPRGVVAHGPTAGVGITPGSQLCRRPRQDAAGVAERHAAGAGIVKPGGGGKAQSGGGRVRGAGGSGGAGVKARPQDAAAHALQSAALCTLWVARHAARELGRPTTAEVTPTPQQLQGSPSVMNTAEAPTPPPSPLLSLPHPPLLSPLPLPSPPFPSAPP